MIFSSKYEIVDIADEFIAVPVGEGAINNKRVIALSNAAAFLLKQMSSQKTKEELIELLIDEYDLEKRIAIKDIDTFLETMINMGLIID